MPPSEPSGVKCWTFESAGLVQAGVHHHRVVLLESAVQVPDALLTPPEARQVLREGAGRRVVHGHRGAHRLVLLFDFVHELVVV